MSWSMVSVPVESCTCLVSRSTTMMGSDMNELEFLRNAFDAAPKRRALYRAARIGPRGSAACPGWRAAAHAAHPRRRRQPVGGIRPAARQRLGGAAGAAAGAGGNAASVVNASISGDTTAGGRSRLPALLQQHPPTSSLSNSAATTRCAACRWTPRRRTWRPWPRPRAGRRRQGAVVGMQVPPNYGRQLRRALRGPVRDVAAARTPPWCPSC